MVSSKDDHPFCHLFASSIAAVVNFPLWKASTIGQSAFDIGGERKSFVERYVQALKPPYKGVFATIFGMSWARAFIFYGSDRGKVFMEKNGAKSHFASVMFPPLVCSTLVQLINMPIIRASITLQDPAQKETNLIGMLKHLHATRGVAGLWHGTSAGVMKTVPKYCVAVLVKDVMEEWLAPVSREDHSWAPVFRSAKKSVAAGLAGAALTNPVDVLRNEMFKTDLGPRETFQKLMKTEGWRFAFRGMDKNLIAVSIPITLTIFATDLLIRFQERDEGRAIR